MSNCGFLVISCFVSLMLLELNSGIKLFFKKRIFNIIFEII